MSDADTLARLRALVAEAEALDKGAQVGPWFWYKEDDGTFTLDAGQLDNEGSVWDAESGITAGIDEDEPYFSDRVESCKGDRAFIARARTLLPLLTAALREFLDDDKNGRGDAWISFSVNAKRLARALGDAPGGEGGGERP